MTPRRVGNDLRNLVDWLVEHGIAIFAQPYREYFVDGMLRVCLESSTASRSPVTLNTFGTIAEYRQYVDVGAYSVILSDGALLRLSYDFRQQELAGHSLLYYPCPIVAEQELFASEPLLDLLDVFQQSSDHFRLRTPLRFDFDPDRARVDHSASHLHMQHSECRIPVVAPLSVACFVDFVFRHLYPQIWRNSEFLRGLRRPAVRYCITRDEGKFPHFAVGTG